MRPAYEDVQAHYDISNEFFGLFQDPTRTYSSAYYERDDMTLEEAQIAKIDLALGKLGLQPGMTLLDVGCGWASVMKRAVEQYDVNVVGLTLSKNQHALGQQILDQIDTGRSRRVLLRGWEEFDEPVDRIVSIEAFEAFPKSRYKAFFDTVLPHHAERRPDGSADDHGAPAQALAGNGHPDHHDRPAVHEVHRRGDLSRRRGAVRRRRHRILNDAGFSVEELQKLTPITSAHSTPGRTKLEAARDEAIAVTSTEVYDRYMRYLTGCSDFFRRNISEVGQFTLVKR